MSRVDEQTRQELEDAAGAYEQAPARLRTAILEAARAGERPAAIVKAIRHVYTYDYVAKLIRDDRKSKDA
jgi:hypothetical protein